MKYLPIWVFLLCVQGHAEAQSGTADERASCNASFHQTCQPEPTSGASSSGFAAPIGVLGSSGLEGGLVALLIMVGIARRRYRRVAGSARKVNQAGAFAMTEFHQQNNTRRALSGGDSPDRP